MSHIERISQLDGPSRAAIIFLCLDRDQGSKIMQDLDERQIVAVTQAMAGLGNVNNDVVEEVIQDFLSKMANGGGLSGDVNAAQEMLLKFMSPEEVATIMGEVRGPLMGKNLWDRFSALNESIIANYLRGENPQTSAVVLSKVPVAIAAKVLPLFPPELGFDIIERMIKLESIGRDTLHSIEEVLQKEFLSTASRASSIDPHQRMADIFNLLDGENFERVSNKLEESMPDTLQRIKQKMFTFDDLVRLTPQDLSRVMRAVENNQLAMALKLAKQDIREVFLAALSERSRAILREDMATLGAVRMKMAQEAQSELVAAAKRLADEGQIKLPSPDDDDAIIQ